METGREGREGDRKGRKGWIEIGVKEGRKRVRRKKEDKEVRNDRIGSEGGIHGKYNSIMIHSLTPAL